MQSSCKVHNEFSATRFVPFQVHRDQAFHHLALSFSNQRKIRRGLGGSHSKLNPVMNEMSNFGAPDLVLAGQTIYVRARASDPAPLDNCCFFSRLCEVPGQILSAFATPDNDVSVVFRAHLEPLIPSAQAASALLLPMKLNNSSFTRSLSVEHIP